MPEPAEPESLIICRVKMPDSVILDFLNLHKHHFFPVVLTSPWQAYINVQPLLNSCHDVETETYNDIYSKLFFLFDDYMKFPWREDERLEIFIDMLEHDSTHIDDSDSNPDAAPINHEHEPVIA